LQATEHCWPAIVPGAVLALPDGIGINSQGLRAPRGRVPARLSRPCRIEPSSCNSNVLLNHLRQLAENLSRRIDPKAEKDYSKNKDHQTHGEGIQVKFPCEHLRHPLDREQAALLRLTD
jgi:hypothetical protein